MGLGNRETGGTGANLYSDEGVLDEAVTGHADVGHLDVDEREAGDEDVLDDGEAGQGVIDLDGVELEQETKEEKVNIWPQRITP